MTILISVAFCYKYADSHSIEMYVASDSSYTQKEDERNTNKNEWLTVLFVIKKKIKIISCQILENEKQLKLILSRMNK